MRSTWALAAWICICGCLANLSDAATYTMILGVEQRNQNVGNATYDFTFWIQGPIGSTSRLKLVSPVGIIHQPNAGLSSPVIADQEGVSLETLNDEILGNWMLEESLGGITQSYQISLPQVPQELFTTSVPVITSPSHGQTVGKQFDLTWTNPDPGGYGVNYSSFDDVPSFRQVLHRNGPGDYTFDFTDVPDFTPIHFLRFSIFKSLRPLGVMVTPLSSNADSSFVGRSVTFEIHSPSISFTVVPEPATVVLWGLAVICATGRRGVARGLARLRCATPRG